VVADVPVAVVLAAAVAMVAVAVEDVRAIVAAAAVNLPIVRRVPKLQSSWPHLRRSKRARTAAARKAARMIPMVEP
jgi:hypothetical protein